ncbi:MAG: MgtC/SapB family protein [Aquabacterium sp.]|uniref:MgtC/SapB family protein n=1 Tax=Aquabacterium sp. TaxID=1872578 RepID=UPI001D7600DF|nr:MgtC/SapB family protein [Aquabacterium sp.]MBT9610410.1 MgtC/SapB family protein [Aquabacterium sp.]
MLQIGALSAEQVGVVVALGAGMLIGLERERRKGEGPQRESAGLRTFMVAALLGVCAQIVSVALAAVALLGVTVLAALSYLRSRSDDPGLTTELALVTTALIGMLAVPQPELAAAAAVLLASLLAARERLHHFATHWLSEDELHDGLLLAALLLILLPLLPAQSLMWLGGLSPRRMLALLVVILAMQALSHVAQRLLGSRLGLPVSGLLGGFVSSTATITAMGGRVRSGQTPLQLACSAAVLSSAATWMQVALMASVVVPGGLLEWLPMVLVGVAAPLVIGVLLWRRASATAPGGLPPGRRVLRLREAATVGALLIAGAVVVNLAHQRGDLGLMLGTGIAALADAHAPMVALMSMSGTGLIGHDAAMSGVLLAITVNSATRSVAAWVSGGRVYGLVVAAALGVNVALVWAWHWG